jgi:hypothetical protein
VNSIGFIVSRNGRQSYSIAVLTNNQSSWDYGIATIEGLANRINTAAGRP